MKPLLVSSLAGFTVVIAYVSMAVEPSKPPAIKIGDTFTAAAPGSIKIEGWLGEKMQASIDNRVMAQDLSLIMKAYQERFEENSGHWRGEYWGKWFTSASLALSYQPTPEHRKVIDLGVEELLKTQTPDGYIGTYKADKHLGIWDVWSRKYSMLGLIADYDLNGNKASLEAACRAADHLLKEAPPGEFNLTENGIDVLQGLSSSSVLQPIAQLYQRTGNKRYLELANDIISNWSRGNKLISDGLRLLEHAADGTPPAKIASRKAYEMMSCFEGLCEMYRATGNKTYLDRAVQFAQSIRKSELMIHGSGSNQELWADGKRTQTETLEQPVETCVTTTWMGLCNQLLRLTGDPLWADELEISLYNALLGSMTPDGAWWAYFSPLAGQRVPSHYQHEDVQMSCCVANGPRGLLLTPKWAMMGFDGGIVVNLYAPGEAVHNLASGQKVTVKQETDYPKGDTVNLTVSPAAKARFALKLRVPAWSKTSSLTVNGEAFPTQAASYAVIDREWAPNDKVVLTLDLRGRAIAAPSGAPAYSVMRGPIVLALDDRLIKKQDIAVRLVTDSDGFVKLTPRNEKNQKIWLSFDVPFKVQPKHYFDHHEITLGMCDYASAGNGWSGENLFRVWLPQPLFLRNAFPEDTWRLTCPGTDECPPIPVDTSVKHPDGKPKTGAGKGNFERKDL
ncbi:MAG: beta-L-arabinofuranosidase domain-containing protein [Akkermansiaceae bacterium]